MRFLEDQLQASQEQAQTLEEQLAEQREAQDDAHTQSLESLTKQLHEERVEKRRSDAQVDELKRVVGALEMQHKHGADRIVALERQLETTKRDVEERELGLQDVASLRAEAEGYRTKTEELRSKLEQESKANLAVKKQMEDSLKAVDNGMAKLNEEKARFEEEKRKVEDQRRHYEKAGTDVLKVLNDANQKIIALEEHKWRLEDQCNELRGMYEREKKSFEQQRHKLEQDVAKYKLAYEEDMERERAAHHQEARHLKAELETQGRERGVCERTLDETREQLRERSNEVEELRNKLADTEHRFLSTTSQHEQAIHVHAREVGEWARERDERNKEKEALVRAAAEAQAEKTRLERELDEDRRKFEGLKRLLG